MNKKFLFAAVALVALASCSTDEFIGENTNSPDSPNSGAIVFGLGVNGATRADMYGSAAAEMLGNHFYVTGTKGTEAATSPSPTLVFDNYLVHYEANTAGTKESNTANWEYVGVTPGIAPYADYAKLSSLNSQTIKYWDYSAAQYDFLAFSTGTWKAVSSTTPTAANKEIGVTAMKYGTDLAGSATAYTFYLPSKDALSNTYISDITEVGKTGFGKEVTLQFKNLGSKVRVALYETVPGYSVKDVKFYTSETSPINSEDGSYVAPIENATLISTEAKGFPTAGSIAVSFPYVGTSNQGPEAYDKASATVTTSEGAQTQNFGALTNQLVTGEDAEKGYDDSGNKIATTKEYLGRTLPTASFAGSAIGTFTSSETAQYYQAVFPAASTTYSLTLRVDYTLVSTDGSKEEIKVYGAKAVVPSTYTKWLPNYAYTYIFKISDNTNGWTDQAGTKEGLFPITFDAVVAEATDATGEQATITTVATPTITTYQQNHDITKDEYSKTTGKDIYVQVMDNSTTTPTLVTGLCETNSLIYELSEAASEAKVIDALLMRKTAIGTVSTADVKGRNNLELKNVSTNIDNTVTTIVNGADDKSITVATTTAGKISISGLTKNKSYAYVYISTASTGEINQYEPISVTVNNALSGNSSDTFYALTTAQVSTGTTLTAAEAPNKDYLYFSKTGNGTGITTYSYISPMGKTTMPIGCIKVAKTVLEANSIAGDQNAEGNTFYFDKYITNDGKYAVKVIRIVA